VDLIRRIKKFKPDFFKFPENRVRHQEGIIEFSMKKFIIYSKSLSLDVFYRH